MTKYSSTILIILTALVGAGLFAIYSAGSFQSLSTNSSTYQFFSKQVIWVIIGMIALYAGMVTPIEKVQKYWYYIYGVTVILLLLVFVPKIGNEVKGAHRWIGFPGFNIQPSEIAKITLIFTAASFLSRQDLSMMSFSRLSALTLIPVALTFCEPDVGTSVILVTVWFCMAFVGGLPGKYVAGIFAISAILIVSFAALKFDHVQARLKTFFAKDKQEMGSYYQPKQSLIGLGSGGMFGVGPGKGIQKMKYLPEAHSDFILSTIGEEFGFAGVSVILFLLAGLAGTLTMAALKIKNRFAFLYLAGIIVLLVMEFIVNVGVVTAAFPTKGLGLPFVSYGGSNLVKWMLAIGFAIALIEQNLGTNKQETPTQEEIQPATQPAQ